MKIRAKISNIKKSDKKFYLMKILEKVNRKIFCNREY